MQKIAGHFVILLHSTAEGEHYDLMLEEQNSLKTWQFEEFPAAGKMAKLIAPHRKAYLDYEGPISENRGNVKRVDQGTFEAEIFDTRWDIIFNGCDLNGKYSIEKVTESWILTKR